MTTKRFLLWLSLAALFCPSAQADAGHDHGAAPAAVSGPALPRFTAMSDQFEMVGIVDDRSLTLYLDRFADNTPASGAKVDLEIAGAKVPLQESQPGEFHGMLASALPTGTSAVTATVVDRADTDILAADLVRQADTHGASATGRSWKRPLLWVAAGLASAAVAFAFIRRAALSRRSRIGGAA
ncbi:hypothetical protein [Xylophilus sp. GOD-11R]|uniref:hypothetical protein n=1 Tax=Xylophilus sp. GOD-11R TaxID=3089814 RepID=UPI00298C16C8|nr:hypothetical protein [Xylophilus sp. GOD-11R]WPB58013.1 hypothetical protein R9X41_05040 [Xylophilus sp. GOD-11R]